MKRRNAFRFALLGATAVLVGCSASKEEVLVYDSVESCITAGQQDAAVCRSEFAKAERLHAEVAPRYAGADQCYSDFGYNRCRQSSGSLWLPFMMGYMLAPRGGATYISSQPLYRPSANPNRYYTAANQQIGAASANGRTQVATSKVGQPAARTRTVARGGFGRRAAGRGAGG